ncbi:MAG: chitobiase/beta-hexosaminidase C-terminal domain-containing protein [Cytophagales bacterium]|nr:chitobiase/beta-hexosaminidase C-terminal domain-containing protein [Cytophagales bacterium]
MAQVQPEHPKRYYVAEDGKLYWQAEKPVFLFVSENPDGSESKRLESETTPEHTNPLYLDTEGINYVRTKWAVDQTTKKTISPQQELVFEIYRDGNSPITEVNFSAPNAFQSEDVVFYGQDLSISATAKDQLSGLKGIYYAVNGQDYTPYDAPLTYSADGDYSFKFYSLDNVGNAETPQSFDFTLDLTSPTTRYTVTGDKTSEILSPRTIIQLEGEDGSSGMENIYFRIDSGQDQRFRESVALTALAEGDHTLTYYSVDNVGNKEANRTYDFYMDRTSPEVIASVVGDQYQNRGRVFISVRTKVKLEASDNKAGIKRVWYKIDDGPEIPYKEPFELPKSKGKHIIEYYATDKVNNNFKSLFDESTSGRESLDIDVEAPEIDFAYAGDQFFSRDTAFITSKTDIGLSAVDNDAGVKAVGYKINGGKGQVYEGPFKLEEEGVYVVDFYGTDQVNNRNSKTFYFTVDNTGPAIEQILSMEPVGSISLNDEPAPLPVYSKGVKLYLAATDAVIDTDAIYYTINDGEEKRYTEPIEINSLGIVSYKIRATDKLGNTSNTDTFSIFVK